MKAWTTILAASSVMDLTTGRSVVKAGNIRTGKTTAHGLPSTTGCRQDRYVTNCYSVDAELRAQPHDLSLARIESKAGSIKPVTEVCHTPSMAS